MKTGKIIFANVLLACASAGSIFSNGQPAHHKGSSSDTTIRPFTARIPESAVSELKRRISKTNWPDKETVADQSQGIRLQMLQSLLQYWGTKYDWRKAEAKLNRYPQFVTEIDGVDIHFIHVRSKEANAVPLILTHGWPGSVFEMLKIIDPLTNPKAFSGRPEDAFDVVIPSLPGYGFSGHPTEQGWGPERIAKAWDTLMKRLGYTTYMAQGGDWGAAITLMMGKQAPEGLLGIHLNLVPALPTEVAQALARGEPAPVGLTDDERMQYEVLSISSKRGFSAYNVMMTARPQALGYGISDSPAGLAAWLLNHPGFAHWIASENERRLPSTEDVLDNISLYWLTNTATSASRLYWENAGRSPLVAAAWKTTEITIPVTVSIFNEDAYRPPRTWIERAYPSLVYFNLVEKGGHFAAWEQPGLFTKEIQAAFKGLRK